MPHDPPWLTAYVGRSGRVHDHTATDSVGRAAGTRLDRYLALPHTKDSSGARIECVQLFKCCGSASTPYHLYLSKMPEEEKKEGEEDYWCPNSLKMSWVCYHKTFQLPHPLVPEGHGQNCKREGGCSAEKLVDDYIVYVDIFNTQAIHSPNLQAHQSKTVWSKVPSVSPIIPKVTYTDPFQLIALLPQATCSCTNTIPKQGRFAISRWSTENWIASILGVVGYFTVKSGNYRDRLSIIRG